MEVNVKRSETVKPKTLKIHMKVVDTFEFELLDSNGKTIAEQDEGYVPSFMPDDHHGDYLILDIDVETGVVTNWLKPQIFANELQDWLDARDE